MLAEVKERIQIILHNASQHLAQGGKINKHCIATKDGTPYPDVCNAVLAIRSNKNRVCPGTCAARQEAEQMAARVSQKGI